jgi:hypothetical protein
VLAAVRVYGNVTNPEELSGEELIEIFRQVEYIREQELKQQMKLWNIK